MKRSIVFIGIIGIVVAGIIFLSTNEKNKSDLANKAFRMRNNIKPPATTEVQTQTYKVIAAGLDVPWAIVFLPASPANGQGGPDKSLLITERSGRVLLIDSNGKLKEKEVATFDKVKEIGEGGLLGVVIDPKFSQNRYVYFYYTYEENGKTYNKVERYQYEVIRLAIACEENNPNCDSPTPRLAKDKVIVDKIPSSSNHNGGRIKFGPDGFLYITTGDAQNPPQAQDKNALGGKILRVTNEGKPAPGNPFDNLVYSYGHRNPQGLAWDNQGRLWATEHGRSGALSGLDELNLIEKGKNYGWPIIQGDEAKIGMETAKLNSGADVTWAPAGAAIIDNSLFFAGLRGQTLYEAIIDGQKITLKEHFKGQFGRIREVIVGPDNLLYITTSNKDGRGNPTADDDKIIQINPKSLK